MMEIALFNSPLGNIEISGDHDGVQSIRIYKSKTKTINTIPNVLKDSAIQIQEYLSKERTEFTFPINAKGTAFQCKIWQILRTIPYGKTTTYLNIAQQYGNVKAIRAVGAAIGKNPILIAVPCHRVIGSNGSLVGFASGIDKKKWLLEKEGFPFQMEAQF